jgi:ATP-dependent RNA helicase RhlE|tara:strand:+ start:147690 stop:148952 length:1263 start_codon:yes stop_codon:yes gene_type:complete
MNTTNFHDLGLIEPLTRVLDENHYITPTPIQQSAIPTLLEKRDLLGVAQTGTGKTAAFSLPVLQHLFTTQHTFKPRTARALVLAPTRELAIQIADNCLIYSKYLSLSQTTIYGGVNQKRQVKMMSKGVDLLIATPGRLLDLMQQGHVDLGSVSHLILDEADRMLDMGFIHDIKKIIAKIPKQRQTLLFSATMPGSISKLANSLLNNPKTVEVTPEVVTVEKIKQSLYRVAKQDKRALLVTLLDNEAISKGIIFSRTKHGANRIVKELDSAGITSAAIHGNKSQSARQKALAAFKDGEIRVLVATDIAARGIDVDNITHVINYDLPAEAESYVHRIGRTARAGTQGTALSFCDETEGKVLKAIERLIKFEIETVETPELKRIANKGPAPKDRNVTSHKRNSNMPKNYQTPKNFRRPTKGCK